MLNVSTAAAAPITGGGTSNTSFLVGGLQEPNTQTTKVSSTFWIETVKGSGGAHDFLQLQYSQTAMLKFDEDIIWPHVTVGTLRKHVPLTVPATFVDPHIPADILAKIRAG